MWKDTVVNETRKVRDEYAAKFEYDLAVIFRDLKEKEEHNREKVVRLQPRLLASGISSPGTKQQ